MSLAVDLDSFHQAFNIGKVPLKVNPRTTEFLGFFILWRGRSAVSPGTHQCLGARHAPAPIKPSNCHQILLEWSSSMRDYCCKTRSRLRLLAVLFILGCCQFAATGCGGDSEATAPDEEEESYLLTVETCGGVWGYPEPIVFEYTWVETIYYLYSLRRGYSSMMVELDSVAVPDSGSFIMNRDHNLEVFCSKKVKWTLQLEKDVYYCVPAVGDDGTIYVSTGIYIGTDWGSIYAVAPGGTIKWSYDCENNPYSPAIGPDGTVYVQDFRNIVYALSPSGDLRWKFHDFEYPEHPVYFVGQRVPAIGADGTVYIAADGLYAIDPDTGERIWRFTPYNARSCRQSPVIGEDGTIYVTIHQDDLFAVNPNGTERWHIKFDHETDMSFTSPSIDTDGTLYFGVESGGESTVWAIDSEGTVKWKYPVDGSYCHVRGTPTIGADGSIYVPTKACPTNKGRVTALSPGGTVIWQYVVERPGDPSPLEDVYSSPTVGADGMIYFGAENEYFYALNADGSLNWLSEIGAINWSSAAIMPDGTLYIGDHHIRNGNNGGLHAIETTSMGYAASPWPCFRHDRKNTGRYGAFQE